MITGDMEYLFSWPDSILKKGQGEKSEETAIFKDSVSKCLEFLCKKFVVKYPKFKDIDEMPVALESVAKYRLTPFFLTSDHAQGLGVHFGV